MNLAGHLKSLRRCCIYKKKLADPLLWWNFRAARVWLYVCRLFMLATELDRDLRVNRLLNDNEINRIKADGVFRDLPNLIKVDLRRNKISSIENNAFEGASSLVDL